MRVQTTFLFVAALLGYGTGDGFAILEWVAVVFVSVLFHELGHAIMARRAGFRPWIELHGMGGLTHLERTESTPPASWASDLTIALAGPFFGFALGAVVWAAARTFPLIEEHDAARALVGDLLWANVGWSLLNLLPMLPWDGGLAARAVLCRLLPTRGEPVSYGVSVVVSTTGLALALYSRRLWMAYLAGRALVDSLLMLRKNRFEVRLGRAWDLWDRGLLEPTRRTAAALAAHAPDPFSRGRAVELLVYACLGLQDSRGARAAYEAYPARVPKSALLAGVVELDSGDRRTAIPHLLRVPLALLRRVFSSLVVEWASHGSEDRAKDWLDEATCRALPHDIMQELEESLSRQGNGALSAHIRDMRSLTPQPPFLSEPASPTPAG